MIDLRQGDCLELMKDIPDKSIDMILADLPYGTTKNKWDSIIPLDALWLQYERVIKDSGAIVLTSQTPFDKILGVSKINLLRYEWVWVKDNSTGFLNAKKMPLKKHENILVSYKKLPVYNPQYTSGSPYVARRRGTSIPDTYRAMTRTDTISDGRRYPVSILNMNTDRGLHPTQKPVALFEYLIKTYTNEGDLVLDNCMGSGTTGVACKNLNRNFIGMELDEKYFEIAKNRIATLNPNGDKR